MIAEKKVKNTTGSDITRLGLVLPAGEYVTIEPQFYVRWAALFDEYQTEVASGDIVVNNGTSDLNATVGLEYLKSLDPHFLQHDGIDLGFRKTINFTDNLSVVTSTPGVLEVKGDLFGAIDNDLDKMQFARQGSSSNNVYLLTLNNIASNASPDMFAYDTYLRAVSVSNSGFCDPFEIAVWRANDDYSERIIIYQKTFSVANGNFNGYTGFQALDPQIAVNGGYGIYVQVTSVGNPKPSDLNLIIWTRKR